jgi:hypothetical protein
MNGNFFMGVQLNSFEEKNKNEDEEEESLGLICG